MNHKELKQMLLSDDEIQKEYNHLEPIYAITREIINLRIENGLTQKELAEKIGTKQSAISRLENGSYNPSLEFLTRVAHALGKEVHISFS